MGGDKGGGGCSDYIETWETLGRAAEAVSLWWIAARSWRGQAPLMGTRHVVRVGCCGDASALLAPADEMDHEDHRCVGFMTGAVDNALGAP